VVKASNRPTMDWNTVASNSLDAAAVAWASRPDCGAVVSLCGTVRDHSERRAGVTRLAYDAYEEPTTSCYAVSSLLPLVRRGRGLEQVDRPAGQSRPWRGGRMHGHRRRQRKDTL
jgi:MoaE protein